MASILTVDLIVSKKNKQTEKNMSFIAVYTVSQIHINPEKNTKKTHQTIDCLNVPT